MPNIRINGADFFAVETGEGDPIVLVHGSLSDYRTWVMHAREISRRHRVIAYSRRYHFPNATAENDPQYSVALHADDLAGVIRTRAGGAAHVVTSSFGGCVALRLATESPELFKSLVLCEPPLMPWLTRSAEGMKSFLEVKAAQEASDRAFKAGNQRDGVKLFSDMAVGPGFFDATPPRSQARIMDNAYELSLEMAAAAEVYFPRFNCQELAALTVPMLFLCADQSPAHYRIIADELVKCLPRAEKETIPDSAHMIHSTNPLAFSKSVARFLEQGDP